MACSSATADCSAAVERFLDLLTAVRKLCGKDHFACGIIDQGQPSRLTTRIDLEAQWNQLGGLDFTLEHDSERVALEDRCLA